MAQRKRGETGSSTGAKKPRKADSAAKKVTKSESQLQQAQKLVAKALKVGDCREEVSLAAQALQLSQDCAEAYLILAQHSFHAIDALPFFEQARAAGARTLGVAFFKKEAGKFWSKSVTRSYMHACGGFAECLWSIGCREDAITVWREMLFLDRQDHQGTRHILQESLLEMQRTDEVAELLEKYPETSTWWDYNLLLASFQKEGGSDATLKLLKKATKQNKHVIQFLLKDKLPKEELSHDAKAGSSEEAAVYVSGASAAWWQTSGAISWLRRISARKGRAMPKVVATVGPTEESKQRLRELPQEYGLVYQAAVHQFSVWTTEGDQHVRPWVIVMVNCNDRLIVAQEMLMQRPSTEAVWDRLEQGMREPFAGKPSRPSEIQAYKHPVWEELRPHLEEIGIDVIYRKPVDEIDYILKQLEPVFSSGPPESGLLNSRGITPQLAGAFYTAAAEFYRSAPWQYCSDDRPIEVRFSDEPNRVYYAVVMGQGGDTYGMTLYDDIQSVFDHWSGSDPTDESSLDAVAVSVYFGEPFELTAIDVDAMERNNWPAASPEAYPSVLRTDPELMYCPPNAKDLKRIEICLRAIPEFARRHFRERQAEETLAVSTGAEVSKTVSKASRKKSTGKPKKVHLSWFEEDADEHGHDHDHDHDHDGCVDTSCTTHDHDH